MKHFTCTKCGFKFSLAADFENMSEEEFAEVSACPCGGLMIEDFSIDELIELVEKANYHIDICFGRSNGKHFLSKINIAYHQIPALLRELKEYKEAEEQGLLHKAPLKNGTPICYLQYSDPEGEYLAHDTYLFGVTEYMLGELGEDVWLTEEEATAALRKRWGNE